MTARTEYCIPCALAGREAGASTVIDGDPMCIHCARAAGAGLEPQSVSLLSGVAHGRQGVETSTLERRGLRQPDAPSAFERRRTETGPTCAICKRGCGRPVHKGRCGGRAIVASVPVHRNPRLRDHGVMPCCGRTPAEVREHRITTRAREVTCGGSEVGS